MEEYKTIDPKLQEHLNTFPMKDKKDREVFNVYVHFLSTSQNGKCVTTLAKITKATKLSYTTVRTALKRLQNKGLIRVATTPKSTEITLLYLTGELVSETDTEENFDASPLVEDIEQSETSEIAEPSIEMVSESAMSEIETFIYDGNNIRIVQLDGAIWFVGKDVATVLGYSDTFGALKKHVDEDDKQNCQNDSFESNRGLTIINESGLYSLILSSKLHKAKEFKHWVTSEVLPTIRKHGAYMTPQKIEEVIMNPDMIIQLALQIKAEQQKNKELKATNDVLVKETNEWDSRKIVVALVRSYGFQRCESDYVKAWNTFYKHLNYTLDINLRLRQTKSGKEKVSLLDLLTPDEMAEAAKAAVAMCEEVNIDTGKVLNATNLMKVKV